MLILDSVQAPMAERSKSRMEWFLLHEFLFLSLHLRHR